MTSLAEEPDKAARNLNKGPTGVDAKPLTDNSLVFKNLQKNKVNIIVFPALQCYIPFCGPSAQLKVQNRRQEGPQPDFPCLSSFSPCDLRQLGSLAMPADIFGQHNWWNCF